MRNSRGILICILLSILFTSQALSEIIVNDRISVDGNIRFRTEVDDRDFDSESGANEYNYLRTQLGFKIQASDDVLVRVKFKDSRFLGTTHNNDKSTSFVDLQEGYILVDKFLRSPVDLQLGRFEMMYGRRRIHGNGGWNNFGPRTFDGIRIISEKGYGGWNLFAVRVVEHGFEQQPFNWPNYVKNDGKESSTYLTAKTDWTRFGLTGSLHGGKFQPIFVVDWAPQGLSQTAKDKYPEADLVFMPGLYVQHQIDNFQIEFDCAIQSGQKNYKDITAWLIAGDVRYQFDSGMQPYFGLGIDMTSGNSKDDPRGSDHMFYAPFMSRHIYLGYMDYFQDVENGLVDLIARIGINPWDNASLTLDIHNFQFMESDVDSTGNTIDQLGQEFDLRFTAPVAEALSIDSAICLFTPADGATSWINKSAGKNNDTSLFFYLAITAKF